MRRKSACSSSPSTSAPRRRHHRRGFRPAVNGLEDRTLLSLSPTFTSVVASVGNAAYGQPVIFTATVSEIPPAGATPTGGTVTFYDGSTALGTASLSGGTATLTATTLPAGEQTISAIYSGDGQNFAGSSSGTIATIAGNGNGAGLASPAEAVIDSHGDLFIAGEGNQGIAEVSQAGIITTFLQGYFVQLHDSGQSGRPLLRLCRRRL